MPDHGARDWYEDGVAEHYREHGATYRNPHSPIIDRCLEIAVERWPLGLDHVLDLAAGAGELTLALKRAAKRRLFIEACDAYTIQAYQDQTGLPCEQLTFEQIARGALRGRRYSLIGCSFALHLCALSQLPVLLLEMAQVTRQLMVLSPHKRPMIREAWGWSLVGEFLEQRVRTRLYESKFEPRPTTLASET